ncbi:hypothetical protein PM082_000567 [Marasmius tenuissimus]|nr:hypothetical protein PM082_000567 [Marasmius tenuissimus]
MYVPFPDLSFVTGCGNLAKNTANTPPNLPCWSCHPPMSVKPILPCVLPLEKVSPPPNSGGRFNVVLLTKVWKSRRAWEAVCASRSQVYEKMMEYSGTGKVSTSIEVVIPNEGAAPQRALPTNLQKQREKDLPEWPPRVEWMEGKEE